ncbi:MAG TPA: HAD family hydrolase [Candidatus Babeliales bacterium]|nr:HAD family hydrolase [Candidatus Babeliales bacterium]
MLNKHIKNHKPILVFDLHGVIFSFSIWAGIKDFWQLSFKQKLLVLRAAGTPGLAWDALKLLFTGGVVEQAVLNIKIKYPKLTGVIPFALKVINNQIPKPEMVKLLQDLKSQNYTLLIFSNIGEQSIEILKHKYPEIFSLFSGELVASASDNYISKPQPAAFKKFLAKLTFVVPARHSIYATAGSSPMGVSNHNNFLLIDDRDKNLQAAQACGMQVLKFKSSVQLALALSKFKRVINL